LLSSYFSEPDGRLCREANKKGQALQACCPKWEWEQKVVGRIKVDDIGEGKADTRRKRLKQSDGDWRRVESLYEVGKEGLSLDSF